MNSSESDDASEGIYPDGGFLVPTRYQRGKFVRELERELADCRRACAELVTDGNCDAHATWHRVHCRDSENPRIGMRNGQLCWLLPNPKA
jgi:hypothetical protein